MFLHDRNLIFFEHPEKRNDEKENNFEGRKCVRNRRGWIYLDRGTVLTNIVLSRLPTATIIGGITKVFPLFGCKKVSPTMLPWQITGSTASTPHQPQILSLYPSAVSVYPLQTTFVVDFSYSCFSLHSLSFFSFFLSSIDNHSTGNVRHGLQAANGANARECMAPGAIKAWLDFFPPNIKLLLRCKMVE